MSKVKTGSHWGMYTVDVEDSKVAHTALDAKRAIEQGTRVAAAL